MSDHNHHSDEENDFHKEELPEGVILRDHVVDGIYEYDQRLPRWWLCILFSVIAFSAVYWLVLDDKTYEGKDKQSLDVRLAAIEAKRLAGSIDVTDNELFWKMSGNPDFIAAGKATYQANCVACHGAELQGGIGFNLVDAEWVHGAAPSSIYVTIDKGIDGKGMQAWGSQLGQKRITEVVAYILSNNDRAQMEASPVQ